MAGRVLFVNVTRQCNVDCDRCYLTPHHRQEKERLSPEIFERLISAPWFKEQSLTVIWEGGEAALIGRSALTGLVSLCAEQLPNARQTMVTNLYGAPEWLIELSHRYFASQIETTLALGKKRSLAGSEAAFLQRFHDSYKAIRKAGIHCPINLELNVETIHLGPERLVDYLELIGADQIEIDVSVAFDLFFNQPAYSPDGYPLLPLTAPYKAFADYVMDLMVNQGARMSKLGITSTLFEQYQRGEKSTMFAVQRGQDFITLNPDGTVTTNPLFSDFPSTYLGDLRQQSAEEILGSVKRERYVRHELRRSMPCMTCKFYSRCAGGPPHVPVMDGSGECAGMKSVWEHFA